MKGKNTKGKSIFLFILTLTVIAGIAAIAYLGIGEKNLLGKDSINLGLDLQGGVNIVYEAAVEKPTPEDMNAALEMIRTRLDKENYTEADAYVEGEKRIRVDIPGVKDPQKAVDDIGATALLKFVDDAGKEVVSGKDIDTATQQIYQDQATGRTVAGISLKLTKEGAKKFAEATKANVGKPIHIVLDDVVLQSPVVNEPILNGEAMISGNFTPDEAKKAAERIQAGSLPFALEPVSSMGIGAKLGMGAFNTSVKAGMIGFAVVIIMMFVLYKMSGLAANIALTLYISLLIIALSAMGATLTLPGIAGIILSIGMAVDANIIIFARIKEELAAGKSIRSAIDAGFDRAFSAILDGNTTTLISAVVLYFLGSGLIKSFATTLGVGIIISMFTALVVTRFILKLFMHMGLKNPMLYGAKKEKEEKESKGFDFIGKRKAFFIVSIVLLVIGMLAMPINNARGKGTLNWDIEFKGGTIMQIDIGKDFDIEKDIRPIVKEVTNDDSAYITQVTGTKEVLITTKPTDNNQRKTLFNKLKEKYQLKDEALLNDSNVMPTISKEILMNAVKAVGLGTLLILAYLAVRFRDWKFGLCAVIAGLFDVVILVGVYAVFRVPVNNSFIAAILTITGYSINDTIIVFDRIRENKGKLKGNDAEIINKSIMQTLARSIITTLTTLVMVLMLFIFGVASVKDFAFPLLIGITSGAYSSIFIASPLLFEMKKMQRNKAQKNKAKAKASR
ncbi:MAG: protein translocase subunit SecD [Cellulosilyticaceae bacterium]